MGKIATFQQKCQLLRYIRVISKILRGGVFRPCYRCYNSTPTCLCECYMFGINRGNVTTSSENITKSFFPCFCDTRNIWHIAPQNNTTRQGWFYSDMVYSIIISHPICMSIILCNFFPFRLCFFLTGVKRG